MTKEVTNLHKNKDVELISTVSKEAESKREIKDHKSVIKDLKSVVKNVVQDKIHSNEGDAKCKEIKRNKNLSASVSLKCDKNPSDSIYSSANRVESLQISSALLPSERESLGI